MKNKNNNFLPIEVVFSPDWWHKNYGISFDRGFFFDPKRRVLDEQAMRKALFDRFGDIGLGEKDSPAKPVIGAVHLAAGYFIAQAIGCEVKYHKDSPPDVIAMNLSDSQFEIWKPPVLSQTQSMIDLSDMISQLKLQFGYVEGDINWSGIHNTALDIRGNALLTDYYDRADTVKRFLKGISDFIIDFVKYLDSQTKTSSISVNRSVGKVNPAVHLHSNCSITMVSNDIYQEFLLPLEQNMSEHLQPFGIHHCGVDMHRLAPLYSKVENAVFFDVGWGSDIAECRKHLPNAFLNIRLSPAKFSTCNPKDIYDDIQLLASKAGDLTKIGFCCINMDSSVPDENIRALFNAVDQIRKKG